jgi:hypothetical protein
MPKLAVSDDYIDLPDLGGGITVPLLSSSGTEEFLLDVRRNRINLTKGTFQNRSRSVIILARLDVGGAPHRNPDGQEVQCPHLHIYREGYGDKWAVPAGSRLMLGADHWSAIQAFMSFCNVVKQPNFNPGLFA